MRNKSNLIGCPICRRKDFRVFYKSAKRQVVGCEHDGLVFVNPQPTKEQIASYYSREYFKAEFPDEKLSGTGFTNYRDEERYIRKYFSQKLKRLEKYKKPNGRFLDVGCALGYGLSEARRRGWKAYGLDISDYAIKVCRQSGLEVRKGPIESARYPEKFSVVFASHTLEHVADPKSFLKKANKLLVTDGILYLAMPNQRSLISIMLGKRWFDFRRDQHLWFFNRDTLGKLLEREGFEVLESRMDWNEFPTKHFFLRLRAYYKNHMVVKLGDRLERAVGLLQPKSLVLPLGNMFVFARKVKDA